MATVALGTRLTVLAGAMLARARRTRRSRPVDVKRVLIAHQLGFGDTLLLTPLVAKLRHNHPAAEIVMTVPRALEPLYANRPYGISTAVYDPVDARTLQPLFARGGFDLAIVPGDARDASLALASDARWIVGFAGERGRTHWAIDDPRPLPDQPAAWGDIVATLAAGLAPPPYRRTDWPDPHSLPVELPASGRYAVLHVGARRERKRWVPERWRALAELLERRGLGVALVAGPGEADLVGEIDPQIRYKHYAGTLDPAQLWRVIATATALVTLDTATAHLGRLVGVPTVALFGPGAPSIHGAGSFWRTSAYRAVTYPEFPCRDEQRVNGRAIAWARNCERTAAECAFAKCMQMIEVQAVADAVEALTAGSR